MPKRLRQQEMREWIMFLVAIGLVIYFAVARIELNPWWLMLFGAMLGLSVLVRGAQKALGDDDKKDDEPPKPPPSPSESARLTRIQHHLDRHTDVQR